MSVKVVVSCSVLYAVLDVAVVTVLYTHGSQLSVFKEDVLNFDIRQSVLDLWGAMLLRAPLLLGACIGVSWNREDGPSRVAKLTTLIVFICLIIINYTLAKMLMLTELQPLTHQPWLLSMICWTCASSVGVMLLWSLLGSNSLSSSGGGGRSEDTENLVEAAGEVEQEVPCDRKKEGNQEKEKTSSGATLGRLLSYCRKDSGLLSVAVLFLLISAVCECLWHKPVQSVQSCPLKRRVTFFYFLCFLWEIG